MIHMAKHPSMSDGTRARTEVWKMPSRMPATVNTPPTTAHVVVTKWYHARRFSATMICTGDSAYENCAARARHRQALWWSLSGSTTTAIYCSDLRWRQRKGERAPRASFHEASHECTRLSMEQHANKHGVRQVGVMQRRIRANQGCRAGLHVHGTCMLAPRRRWGHRHTLAVRVHRACLPALITS
jgi:hypothetical protein